MQNSLYRELFYLQIDYIMGLIFTLKGTAIRNFVANQSCVHNSFLYCTNTHSQSETSYRILSPLQIYFLPYLWCKLRVLWGQGRRQLLIILPSNWNEIQLACLGIKLILLNQNFFRL